MPDDPRRRLDDVPDLADAPLDWDPARRRFRDDDGDGASERDGAGTGEAPGAAPAADDRRLRIAAPPEGGRSVPPPRRAPVVVDPEPPAAGAAATAGPSATAGADRTSVASAPGGSRAASEVPRPAASVVVPAPGAAAGAGDGAPTPAARPGAPSRSAPTGTAATTRWPPSRRTVLRSVGALLALVVLGTAAGLLWGWRQFESIETVDLTGLLATDDGTNYLIVGSDTREGIDPDDPNASAILGPEAPVGSERSDTILILRVDGDGARMLSVPRDLLVTVAETGQRTRINAAFNGGPPRLVATLTDQLDLPIHHYLEIDFASFQDLVDALGGITIDFPYPASDDRSGLKVEQSGPVTLDGTQALAYVRSRYYVEYVDGVPVREGTGDIGRVARQQRFLAALVSEIGSTRNPLRMASAASTLADGMRIDDDLGYLEALRLALRFRSLDPEPTALPTTNATLGSGAQVLTLVQPGADEILATFGSSGSRTG